MHRTKGDYLATHGIFPHIKQKLINTLRKGFFSINFDESSVLAKSQLDINVSYLENCLVRKQNFCTVSLEGGTTAQEIVDAVVDEFEKNLVPVANVVFVTTDGCSTMIGKDNGVHTLMRKILPHLPSWGGCVAHDASNILKSAVPKLSPNLTKMYSALHSYLNTASLHRKRKYEDVCAENGLIPQAVPQMLDIRFRVIVRLAKWMEDDDRCIYLYIKQLEDSLRAEPNKEPSDTEMTILTEYKSNYLEVRLTNKFILDVSSPLIKFLNIFESTDVLIHKQFESILDLVYNFLSKFLKNAGLKDGEETLSGKKLLQVDYTDKKLQLDDKRIFLGEKVDSFLTEMGLSRDSKEIQSWLKRVRLFYEEALSKMFKYFGPSLKSKTLRYLSVLCPSATSKLSLDELRTRWIYLGESFPNIVSSSEVYSLMDEVVKLKALDGLDKEVEPDVFFEELSSLTDENGNKAFPVMTKLGPALLTGHNSGSNAERDFSLMVRLLSIFDDLFTFIFNQNGLADDPKRNKTSQLRLNTRLSIKSSIHNLKHCCKLCKELKRENKERVKMGEKAKTSTHCHCTQWSPSDELISEVIGGKPSQRFKQDEKVKQDKGKIKELLFSEARDRDAIVKKADMEREKQVLKKKIEEVEKMKDKPAKVSKPKEAEAAAAAAKKKRKLKKVEKDEKIAAKRKRLSLIL